MRQAREEGSIQGKEQRQWHEEESTTGLQEELGGTKGKGTAEQTRAGLNG